MDPPPADLRLRAAGTTWSASTARPSPPASPDRPTTPWPASPSPCPSCGDDVALPAGPSQLRTGDGRDLGLQVDSLTLRSAAGGTAEPGDGLVLPDATSVPSQVVDQDRWRSTVEVGPRDEDTWLVIGQSDNAGWTASIDGEDLGPAGAGRRLLLGLPHPGRCRPGHRRGGVGAPAGRLRRVWPPRRVAALLCLLLALRPWRWRPARPRPSTAEPRDERPLAPGARACPPPAGPRSGLADHRRPGRRWPWSSGPWP